MRLPLIARSDLSPEQRPIAEDMRAGIEKSFQGFKSIAENGALIGPWKSVAARTEVRKADLGAHECALRLPLPSKTGSRGRDPSHRREISLRLSDLCPRLLGSHERRQDRHHRGQ